MWVCSFVYLILGSNIHLKSLAGGLGKHFVKYSSGENCPIGSMIVDIYKCKAASAILGLNYQVVTSHFISSHLAPAGCYWSGEKSYFNKGFDPYQTSPESFGASGGVCVKGKSKNCHGGK